MDWCSKTGWSRLLTLGAMSWFIFWACAPMMSAQAAPPVPPLATQPSYAASMITAIRVPTGMSWEGDKLGRFDAEVGLQFLNLSLRDPGPPDVLGDLRTGELTPYVGLGYARAFGEAAKTPAATH